MAKLHTHGIDWHFDHPPEAVWPALADTGRFNEATGLPKHVIREAVQPDGSVRFFSEAKAGPVTLAWEDIPVEWVTGRWLRHLRIFSRGPLRSLCAMLDLKPDGRGGTDCHTDAQGCSGTGDGITEGASRSHPTNALSHGSEAHVGVSERRAPRETR